MYIPELFKVEDERLIDSFLRRYSFATVISAQDGLMEAVHVPILIASDKRTVSFHVATANPIVNFFKPGTQALVIFNGPHGYVSPRWYTRPNVPTWNYAAVHLYCRMGEPLDQKSVFRDLERLVSSYESEEFVKKMFVGADLGTVTKQIPGIVGYEALVTDIQTKFKLSQNRDQASRETVIRELKESPLSSDVELGNFMEDFYTR